MSAEAVEDLWRRVLRTVLAVIGIAPVTTLLQYPVIVALLRRPASLSLNLLDSHPETLRILGSAIAKRDSEPDEHNYRVTIMSARLAGNVGLILK